MNKPMKDIPVVVAPFVRSPYNYDVRGVSDETGLKCLDESLAVQSAADDADINTIVRRFGLTGELPVGARAPTFGDFTGVKDYKSAVDAVRAASDAFMLMPAEVRSRFGNNPQKFVEFCSDEKNAFDLEKLGLLSPVAVERRKAEAEAVRKAEIDAAVAAAGVAAPVNGALKGV